MSFPQTINKSMEVIFQIIEGLFPSFGGVSTVNCQLAKNKPQAISDPGIVKNTKYQRMMQETRKYEQNTENLCRGARSRGAEMDKKVESKKMTARAPPMVAQTTMTQFFIFIFQFMIALIRKLFFLFMS